MKQTNEKRSKESNTRTPSILGSDFITEIRDNQKKMFDKIDDLADKITELEKKNDKKDVEDGYDNKEHRELKEDLKNLEEKIDQKADKTELEGINDNIWKLIMAIIGAAGTLLIFLMGIILKGGS